jgi:hypothetical protein
MGSVVAGAGVNPADQRWGFWPLLPLYPYGRRRTLLSELIPGQLWSLEQLQGCLLRGRAGAAHRGQGPWWLDVGEPSAAHR